MFRSHCKSERTYHPSRVPVPMKTSTFGSAIHLRRQNAVQVHRRSAGVEGGRKMCPPSTLVGPLHARMSFGPPRWIAELRNSAGAEKSMTVRYGGKPCCTEAGLLQIWRDGKSSTNGCRSGMAAAVRLQICRDGSRLPAQLDRSTIRRAAVFTRRYSTLYFSSSSCSAVRPVNSAT